MTRRDPMATLTEWARRYGDIVYYHFFGSPVYFLVHPKHIEQVLLAKAGGMFKGMVSRSLPELFGNGLLTSDGDFWLRQRRLSNAAFHRESIIRYSEIATQEAARVLEGWTDGETRNIHDEMMRVTLRIVLRSLFGGELGSRMEAIEQALNTIMRSSTGWFAVAALLHIPTPAHRCYLRAVHELDDVVYEIIARGKEKLKARGAAADDTSDLLTALLQSRDENGAAMSDQQLRDEVITLLLAGHETTALALTWCWYLLSEDAQAEERLHAELDAQLKGRGPNASDLSRLPYTDGVIREALRLYPPAWRIGRTTREPFEIAGYVLPAGSNIVFSQWVTHRDQRWFPNPEQFQPDRWLSDSIANLPRFAYFPFGGGPRVCIGAGFATMEAILLLVAIAQRFQLQVVPGQRIEPMPSITLRPKHGILVRLRERRGARAAQPPALAAAVSQP